MRALVVGAAPHPGEDAFYAALGRDHDLVVAADAAGEWLIGLGIVPDVVVGDFDSALPGAGERLVGAGSRVIRHPARKDETDLALAVAEARDAGASALTLTAAFSARLDHTLAAIGALARAAAIEAQAREPDMTIRTVRSPERPVLELALDRGTLVSVFAVLGPAEGVTLEGFAYPLAGAHLEPMAGLGVSNVLESPMGRIRIEHGTLLVVTPRTTGP